MAHLSHNQLRLVRKLKLVKYRQEQGRYLVSGLNAARSAARYGKKDLQMVLIERDRQDLLRDIPLPRDIPVFELSRQDFKSISDEKNPQGIALLMGMPGRGAEPIDRRQGLHIFLDRINDPGNLGTIIRSAAWFGLPSLLLGADSVDPFNPKCVRASAGMICAMRIVSGVTAADLQELKQAGYALAATVVPRQADRADPLPERPEKLVIMFGAEASGLHASLLELGDLSISIPRPGYGESLNLASSVAILLYHFTGTSRLLRTPARQ